MESEVALHCKYLQPSHSHQLCYVSHFCLILFNFLAIVTVIDQYNIAKNCTDYSRNIQSVGKNFNVYFYSELSHSFSLFVHITIPTMMLFQYLKPQTTMFPVTLVSQQVAAKKAQKTFFDIVFFTIGLNCIPKHKILLVNRFINPITVTFYTHNSTKNKNVVMLFKVGDLSSKSSFGPFLSQKE